MKTAHHSQSGFALVMTLVLLLTLTIMVASVSQVVNRHSDLTSAVTHRPLAIEAADACIHQALEWMGTPTGQEWLNGDAAMDLAAVGNVLNKRTVLQDTTKAARPISFTRLLEKASCTSVVVSKIDETVVRDEGSEVGTETTYGATDYDSSTYIIKIIAQGIFNVPTNSAGTTIVLDDWNSSSGLATVEVIAEF